MRRFGRGGWFAVSHHLTLRDESLVLIGRPRGTHAAVRSLPSRLLTMARRDAYITDQSVIFRETRRVFWFGRRFGGEAIEVLNKPRSA
jgi:hypothetical protein